MNLKKKISTDLISAMKIGDVLKRDTLRMLDAMIKNTEIEKKKKEEGLTDAETLEVIARAIKQRKDSVAQYASAGRQELAEKEKKEIEILLAYMPEQISEDKIREIIKEIMDRNNYKTMADMGKIMGQVMNQLKGKAEGSVVKKIVEELLS